MAHVKAHTGAAGRVAQAMQPGTQQGRGLHVRRKHPARGANKGVHPQLFGPGAQRLSPKVIEHRRNHVLARPITGGKQRRRLRMREVQAALARQQELAPDRGHRVIQINHDTRARQHLGRHQTSWTTANHDGTRADGGRCSSHKARQGVSRIQFSHGIPTR